MIPLLNFLPSFLLLILSILFLHFLYNIFNPKTTQSKPTNLPKPYPIIGHIILLHETFEWFVSLIHTSPTSTFVLHHPFGDRTILTGHPGTVEHILKTHNHIYQKGPHHKNAFKDFFGDSVITINGNDWKFQRQISSHIFTPKSLQNYIENIVDFELEHRLIPILSEAAKKNKVIDLQHILQRFTFDNSCSIALGYDPEYLSPTLPRAKFSDAFDDAITISFNRFTSPFSIIWRFCRFFNIGREKRLRQAVQEIREFAISIVREKKQELLSGIESNNLLSRLLKYEELDEKLVIDIVITFIFGGRDPTSVGLTWFFWLVHKNEDVQSKIVQEIDQNKNKNEKKGTSVLEEIREMVYMHAALSETMRLYPPVPMDTKQAVKDDVLPDGTLVKKGMLVNYVMYAMGRSEKLWGCDWAEFRPERWLKEEENESNDNVGGKSKFKFIQRDQFSYPVFNAGPRTCQGKDMAYLQMKRIAAGVLSRFRVVPVIQDGLEHVYVASMTAKMAGGFPVRIQERLNDLK